MISLVWSGTKFYWSVDLGNRNTFLSNLKSGISGHGLTVKEVTEQVGDKEKGFILLYADDKLLEYYAEQLQIEFPLVTISFAFNRLNRFYIILVQKQPILLMPACVT